MPRQSDGPIGHGYVAIADGQLLIRHLPPGDFFLRQHRLNGLNDCTDDITLHVSAGVEQDGLLISTTRIMPRLLPAYPSIAKAAAENGQLTIHLRDAGPHTRVTVVGKRYTFQAGMMAQPPIRSSPPSPPS